MIQSIKTREYDCSVCHNHTSIRYDEKMAMELMSKEQMFKFIDTYIISRKGWIKEDDGFMCPVCAVRKDMAYFKEQIEAMENNLRTPVVSDALKATYKKLREAVEKAELQEFFDRMDKMEEGSKE